MDDYDDDDDDVNNEDYDDGYATREMDDCI